VNQPVQAGWSDRAVRGFGQRSPALPGAHTGWVVRSRRQM